MIAFMSHHKTLLECIGNTPLVELKIGIDSKILAKLEFTNPGGSIKDRAALYMIEEAERTGQLRSGGTIVEASSGNQGIALAMIGALKGYRVIITVPDRSAREKIAILRAYGADVYICPTTDDHDDPRGYHFRAEEIAKTTPGAFMPNQFYNKNNAMAHYLSTGPEIWRQTGGQITHFFAGAGTCGTISGVGRFLKEQNPQIQVIGIDAATSKYSSKEPKAYQVEGIGIDVISDLLDHTVIDEIIPVSDEDAFAMTRTLARRYGLLVGISSGAAICGIHCYAPRLCSDAVVTVILADSGKNYLSKIFGQAC